MNAQPIKIALTLMALLVACLLPAVSQADEACSNCNKRHKSSCSYQCDKSDSQLAYDGCVRECLNKVCEKACPKSLTEEAPPSSTQAACRRCLDKEESTGCNTECPPFAPRSAACRHKCAKRKCNQTCSLPDVDTKFEQPAGKYDCELCREQMTQMCQFSQTCNRNQPGYLACQFKCVEDRCAQSCATEGDAREEEE